jgi:hypothetical protein
MAWAKLIGVRNPRRKDGRCLAMPETVVNTATIFNLNTTLNHNTI